MSALIVSLIFLIVGIVALCVMCYGRESEPFLGWVAGVVFTIVGIVTLPLAVREIYEDPDLPTGVKMSVVAGFVSVDGDVKRVLQWQVGQKMDNEATVSIKKLKVENDKPLIVGDIIVKLDNGTTIVLSAEQTVGDRAFH